MSEKHFLEQAVVITRACLAEFKRSRRAVCMDRESGYCLWLGLLSRTLCRFFWRPLLEFTSQNDTVAFLKSSTGLPTPLWRAWKIFERRFQNAEERIPIEQ